MEIDDILRDFIDDECPEYEDFGSDDECCDEAISDSDEEASLPRRIRRCRRQTSATIPGHLQTPINRDEIDLLTRNKEFYCSRHKALKATIERKNSRNLVDVSVDPIRCVQNWVRESCPEGHVNKRLEKLEEAAGNWKLHKQDLLQNLVDLDNETLEDDCERVLRGIGPALRELKAMFTDKCKVEHLKDSICNREITHGNVARYGSLMIERDVAFFNCRCCGNVVLPTSLFLCALDKLQTQFYIHLGWKLADLKQKYPGRSIYDRGSHVYKVLTDCRAELGQHFYKMMNSWEPLVIGWVITQNDDVGGPELFESQMATHTTIREATGKNTPLEILLPTSPAHEDITMALELVGLNKAFGYPTLSGATLFDKFREFGVVDNMPFDLNIINDVFSIMKRDLILNYYKKHRKHLSIKTCDPRLTNYFMKNKPIPQSLTEDYSVWRTIVFDKNFEYDYTPDQTELIRDSALCLPFTFWSKQYDVCAFRILHNKPPPPNFYKECNAHTRTMSAFLKSDENQVRKCIDQWIRYPSEEDHVVNICLKEQELTNYGRAFIVQTEHQRLMQTSAEFNVSSQIFPYVPQQSMTDNEIRENQRTLGHIAEMRDKGEIFVLDLTKWCLFWRPIVTGRCGEIYDQLFGMGNFFTDRHRHSLDCNILPNSRLSPPDYDYLGRPLPGPNFMNRFSGGFEGLCQKPWTHITECACQLAVEQTGVNARILGQGDNQVILVKHQEGVDRADTRERLIRNLYRIFAGIGHRLKREETWNSVLLHEYGKARTYNGNLISSATKKTVSLMPDHNDFFHSIPGGLSAINTMTEGIARVDYNADCAFIMNQMAIADYLVRRKLVSAEAEFGVISSCLMYPLDFGGIPLSSYQKHTVRGHSDSVTQWLSLYMTARDRYRQLYNRVRVLLQLTPRPGRSSTRLIEDVHALNVDSLPTPELAIKDVVKDYLLNSPDVTNPTIKRLCTPHFESIKQDLMHTLLQMRPFFAPLAHELYRNSNVGLLERYPSRFTAVRTIADTVRAESGSTVQETIGRKNRSFRKMFMERLRKMTPDQAINLVDDMHCPTQTARDLRVLSWGMEMVGLSKPPFQHFFNIVSADEATEEHRGQNITIVVDSLAVSAPQALPFRFGRYKGYTGSSTRAKIIKPTMDFAERTGYTQALKELGRLKSWINHIGSAGLGKVVQDLIDEKLAYVTIPPDEDIDMYFDQVMAGNIVHRLLSSSEKQYSMFNSLPGISSHFQQTSNNMRSLTEGGRDFNIFYQLIYITNSISLYNLGCLQGLDPMYFSFINCRDCLEDLTDVHMDIPNPGVIQHQPMPNVEIVPIVPIPAEGINRAMEVLVGMQLAKAIDKDFVTYHRRMEGEAEGKAEVVSMNDFRRLDLLNVLAFTFMYSRHCYELLTVESQHVIDLGYDKSFKTLAECLLNSGRLAEFFQLVDEPVIEHTTATQVERLSAYIARCVVPLIRKNVLSIFPMCLGADIPDLDIPYAQVMRLMARYYPIPGTKIKIKTMLKRGSRRLAIDILNLQVPMVDVIKERIVATWRAQRLPERQSALVTLRGDVHQPEISIMAYGQYMDSRQVEGPVKIDHLSYIPRVVGVISSAASKYLEILGYLRITKLNTDVQTIYSLAEGSGGNVTVLAHVFPSARVFYNTLITNETDPRDDPTDWLPPAAITVISPDRFTNTGLTSGTTDILSPKFHKKLISSFELYPPHLVTMDAESGTDKGNNLEFVKILMPILLEHKVKLAIFKMFLYSIVPLNEVNKLMEGHTDHRWLFVKPICSNPVGHEVFLVVLRNDVGETLNIRHMEEVWEKTFVHIMNAYGMTIDSMHLYLNCAKELAGAFKRAVQPSCLHVKHRLHHMVPGEICSLNCKKLLCTVLDTVNIINEGTNETEFYIAVRRYGVDKTLERILYDLVYLLILHGYAWTSEVDVLSILCNIKITGVKEFRTKSREYIIEQNPSERPMEYPVYLSNWGDAKFYLRDLFNQGKCGCDNSESNIYPLRFQDSLSGRLVNSMLGIGILEKRKLEDVFHLIEDDDFELVGGTGRRKSSRLAKELQIVYM